MENLLYIPSWKPRFPGFSKSSLRCPAANDSILVESSVYGRTTTFPLRREMYNLLETLAKHLSTQDVVVTVKTTPENLILGESKVTFLTDLDFSIPLQDQTPDLPKVWIPTETKLISCFFFQFLFILLFSFLYVFFIIFYKIQSFKRTQALLQRYLVRIRIYVGN